MYREIDIEKWARRSAYEFFKDYEDPFFNIAGNLDISRLYAYSKENGLSVSRAALFFSLRAANAIPEFRTRLSNGKLIEFDKVHATQTILNDDDTFSFCYFENYDDLLEFDRAGQIAVEKYKKLKTFDVETGRLDLIYFSVIPWIAFTSFKHAGRLDRSQTIPRVVFGRIFDQGGRKMMPLSVEVNHAVMDGLHVGRFFEHFQSEVNSL